MVSMAFMVSLFYVAHSFMFVHTEGILKKFKFAFAHTASAKRGEKEFNPNISDAENFLAIKTINFILILLFLDFLGTRYQLNEIFI